MIHSVSQLRALYGSPNERSTKKELRELDVHCREFIKLSPFFVMATCGADGDLDASPRGGPPGFVRVPDSRNLVIPDAQGNNRLDSLSNITATGRVGLVFFIPGVDETLRVNGEASVIADPEVLASFDDSRHAPRTALSVDVHAAYLHCAKALMRSKLWAPESQVPRSAIPSMGQMLKDQLGSREPAESQADMVKRYKPLL